MKCDAIGQSKTFLAGIGRAMRTSKSLQVSEIVVVFLVGADVILCGLTVFGDSQVASIGSIWVANLMMLAVIYLGLWSRAQGWSHFGLDLAAIDWKSITKTVLQSLLVCAIAIFAFVAGAILMAGYRLTE